MADFDSRWIGRVALVTGGGNTTGLAVSEALAKQGMVVIGVDDGPEFDKVEELVDILKNEGALGSLTPYRTDIGSLEKIKKMFIQLKADPDLEGLDVCIHCGVVALGESILDGNPDAWRSMLDTNVLAAAYVTQETVRSMRARDVDDGHIIFLNGMCSHRLVPGNKNLHFLSATKWATRALLEGIRYELRLLDSHIRVSAVSAGVIETDIIQKLFNNDKEKAEGYLSEKKYLEVGDVAQAVIYILEQPPHVQIHDILMRATEQIP